MVLIYSPQLSNRLHYVLQFVFEDVCQNTYKLTSDIQYFKDYSNPKINYSQTRISVDELFIHAQGLLNAEGIKDIPISVNNEKDKIRVFNNDDDDLGFDIFSAIFFFISRYEEYRPFERDKHSRFEANQSFAFKNGFLDRPVVDEWIIELQEKISEKYNTLIWTEKKFNCKPTIDIDQIFAIKGKSIVRVMKPILVNLLRFNFKQIIFILKVRLGLLADPFDQLKNFETLHRKYNLKAIYFILFSKKYNRYDINIPVRNNDFRKAVRDVAKTASVGIHPSYHSRYDYRLVDEEIQLLTNVLNTPINASRQHYLKMRIPNTYKSLLSLGIGNDYTMGFASMPGFRASTSNAFRFYDLKHEQTTFLIIHPFCVMDATFKTYLNYTEEQAYDCIVELINKLKKVNGTFTPLWHNESMSEYGVWKGWSGLYEKMLKAAQ